MMSRGYNAPCTEARKMKISGQPPYFTKHELFARYPWLDDQLIDTCRAGFNPEKPDRQEPGFGFIRSAAPAPFFRARNYKENIR